MLLNLEVCNLAKGDDIFFKICVACRYGKGNELCCKSCYVFIFELSMLLLILLSIPRSWLCLGLEMGVSMS